MINKILIIIYLFVAWIDVLSFNINQSTNTKVNEDSSYKYIGMLDFKNNPAWLLRFWNSDYVQFSSFSDNSWGNYKRRYDAEGNHLNTLGFSGQTKLDDNSVFYGESSYLFDSRSSQNRSLEYETYSGKAFFITDTTKGDFLYHGPQIGFIYSHRLYSNLNLGLQFNYRLLDGLKSNYSQAQSLLRNLNAKTGLLYSFNKKLEAGATFEYFDFQETINVQGNESFMTDIYNYRGDKFAVLVRDDLIFEILQKKGKSLGSQFVFNPSKSIQMGLMAKYSNFHMRNLLSKLKIEDVYSKFEIYNTEFEINYSFWENFYLRNKINYIYSQSWSKHHSWDLVIWKWNTSNLSNDVGLSYKLDEPEILLNISYNTSFFSADSQKYIDNRFNNTNTINHCYSLGIGYGIFRQFYIYNNLSLGKKNIDPIVGGKNIGLFNYNFGTIFSIKDNIKAFLDIYYTKEKSINDNMERKSFNYFLTVKLFR